MLIVAMPRSASTSLLKTLTKIMDLPEVSFKTESNKTHYKKMKGYDLMAPTGCRLYSPKEIIDSTCSKKGIYRDHILPIQEHRNIFMQIPAAYRRVVILKRPAEECYLSDLSRSTKNPNSVPASVQQEVKVQYARFATNLEIMFPESDGFLHVNYHDLIDNHDWWIKRILDYWGFRYPIKDKYMLDMFHISDRFLETENFKKTYTGTPYENVKEIKTPGQEDFYIGHAPGWKEAKNE